MRQKIDEAIEHWKEELADARSMRDGISDHNCYAAGHEDAMIEAAKSFIRTLIQIRDTEASA